MESSEIQTNSIPQTKKYRTRAGLIKNFLSTDDLEITEVQIPYRDGLTQEIPNLPIRNTYCKTLYCLYDSETADVLSEAADASFIISCSICKEQIDINNFYIDIDLQDCIKEINRLKNQCGSNEADLIELCYNRKLLKFYIKDSQGARLSAHKKSSILIKSDIKSVGETKELNFTFVCVTQGLHSQLIAFFPSKHQWSKPITLLDEKTSEPMKLPNHMHRGASDLGEVIFTGGLEGGLISNQTFVFKLDYGVENVALQRKKGMHSSRIFHCGAYVGRKYYVAGGVDSKQFGGRKQDVYLNSVETFDLDSYEWEKMSPLNNRRGFASMCVSADSKYLYVFGGVVQIMEDVGPQYQNVYEIERFSLENKSWEVINVMKLPPFITKEESLNQRFCALAAKEDSFIMFGGVSLQPKTDGYSKPLKYILDSNEVREGPELGVDIRKFESSDMSHGTQTFYEDCYYVAMVANQATKLCVCAKFDTNKDSLTIFS